MSKAQFIASKTEITKLHIEFTCPVCKRKDNIVIFSPKFCTDDFPTSIRSKTEYLTERICRSCFSEMQVDHMRCDL